MASPQKDENTDTTKIETQQKVFSYKDLIKFQSTEIYSSIGRMKDSTKTSAPTYGFGTADRKKQAKVFTSKELCKSQVVGDILQ